jgi:hypothetical protein
MKTHQCIDCMVANLCDDPNAEKEGKRIRLLQMNQNKKPLDN